MIHDHPLVGVLRQHGAPIQTAIAVEVNPVSGLINEVCGSELAGERAARGRAFDEVVVDEVGVVVGARMAADVAGASPVIHDVVDELNGSFGLGITALVTNPEIADEESLLTLAKAAEPLRGDARSDDTILESDVLGGVHVNRVPTAPLNGDVIEYHIFAAVDVNGALLVLPRGKALADAQMPNDDIVRA